MAPYLKPNPKPYQQVQIDESGEPLVSIPDSVFALAQPHPYAALGAPYGDVSPFYLRQGVLQALMQAQATLQHYRPGWKIYIFDAYRPVAVQQFMVQHTFVDVLRQRNLEPAQLTAADEQELWELVYQLWAIPSPDPTTPPPHSTGGAVDLTLVDELGNLVDMGSEIDELSPRSQPNYFAEFAADECRDRATRARAQQAHAHRQLLFEVMKSSGFERHWGEWWHFCLRDQMWTWLRQQQGSTVTVAHYGRADLLA